MLIENSKNANYLESGLALIATDETGNTYIEAMKAGHPKVKAAFVGEEEKKREYIEQGYVLVYVGKNQPEQRMENEIRLALTDDMTEYREKFFHVLYQMLAEPVLISIDTYDLNTVLEDIGHPLRLVDCSGLTLDEIQEAVVQNLDNVEYVPRYVLILICGDISLVDVFDKADCIKDKLAENTEFLFGAQYDQKADDMFVLMN